jgi:hypothetical protein
MEEVLPGIHHWTGHDPTEVRAPVHSHYIEPAGVLVDPTVPDEGLGAFDGMVRPQQVVLTNHRHVRDAERFRDAFDCTIRVPLRAMAEFGALEAEPFNDADDVACGVTAIEIGKLGPDETVLYITHGGGALAFGDGLVHPPGGPIGLPPDDLLGNNPERKRKALKDAFTGLLLRDFDALLFAHGAPLAHEGKRLLRKLVEEPTEHPEFGPFA